MEKRRLGRSDLEISVVTMGGWQAGKAQWTNVHDEDSIAAMRTAYEAGINCFDTAEGYGDGHSEEILGRAVKEFRDKVYIATKVWPGNLAHAKVISACEASLKRLGVECIDLYQIHWPSGSLGSPVVPIADTMSALVQLREQGKIRAIGVSNFNGRQIEEALQQGRIESLQPPYSLFFHPYVEDGTMEVCRKHEIGIIGYSPLAQGLLTGKFHRANRPGQGDNRSHSVLFKNKTYERALEAVEALKPIAEKYGRSTGQLAIQWVLSQPGVTSAIVGARNTDQVRDNARAADFKISPEDLAAIDKIGQRVIDTIPEDKTNMWG